MIDLTEEWICTVRIIDGDVAKYFRRKRLIRCKDSIHFQINKALDRKYCDLTDMVKTEYGHCDGAERIEE